MVSPMPSASSVAMPGRRLDQPGRQRPGLGDAEVQRVVGDLRQLPVGLDHERHVRRLDRDLDVVEADLVEVGQLAAAPTRPCASGVTRRRTSRRASGSSDPPLTPMRIGTPRSRASRATSLMCSGLRMLPGLRRRHCTPASSAARAIRCWWWMSATIGTGERGTIWARPSAASALVAGAAHDVGSRPPPGRRSGRGSRRRRPSSSSSSTGRGSGRRRRRRPRPPGSGGSDGGGRWP